MPMMSPQCRLYVRMIEGSDCFVPTNARRNADGTFHLLDSREFDPEDTSLLLEFLPGDDVRADPRKFRDKPEPVLVATELVRSSFEDRDYWRVLFTVTARQSAPALSVDRLRAIASRIRFEIETGMRWHYPRVVEWARSQNVG